MVPLFKFIWVDFFLCLLLVDFENNVPLDPLEFLEDDSWEFWREPTCPRDKIRMFAF